MDLLRGSITGINNPEPDEGLNSKPVSVSEAGFIFLLQSQIHDRA